MAKIIPGPFKKCPILIKTFTVIALVFGIANAAHATGKLVTPSLSNGSPLDTTLAQCGVTNAGANPVTVQISLFDSIGFLLSTATHEVPPNEFRAQPVTVPGGIHCTIDLIEGKKKAIRGSLIIIDTSTGHTLAAVEAR
jgi:hypothetical protein